MKQMHLIWILSATLTAGFGLPGCGEGGSGGSSAMQIAVIPKGTSHEFWKAVHAGAAARAAESDGKVEIIGCAVIALDGKAGNRCL